MIKFQEKCVLHQGQGHKIKSKASFELSCDKGYTCQASDGYPLTSYDPC